MELYIRIKDGKPFEHPIHGDNFRQAFPSVDTNNLPSEFARFKRVAKPVLKPYEICDGCTYEWENGQIQDVHHVRNMTTEEKDAKKALVKSQWAEYGFPSWVFNEEKCVFDPPVPFPDNHEFYYWDEESNDWLDSRLEK